MFIKKHKNTSTPLTRANMSCAIATIFSSLDFLSSSISMANPSCLVAAISSNLALLSSSSTANLSCSLMTHTFSSLRFLYNSLLSPHFNLLRVARRCFLWFLFSYICVLSSAFLSSILQSLKPVFFKFQVNVSSMRTYFCLCILGHDRHTDILYHAKSRLNRPVWGSLSLPNK